MALLSGGSRVRRVGGLALALLPLTGCLREEIVQPVHGSVAVHAMAVVGGTTFGVTLSRVSTLLIETPLSGASVRLIRDAGTTQLVESGGTSALCFAPLPDDLEDEPRHAECYAATLDSPIQPGETIGLEIELADGTVIVGSTTTPHPVNITMPAAGQDLDVTFFIDDYEFGYAVSRTSVEVRWDDPAARPANVYFEILQVFEDGVERELEPCDLGGPSHGLVHAPARLQAPGSCGIMDSDYAWDSMHVRLHVAAVDESYERYAAAVYEEGTGVIVDFAAAGIERVAGDDVVAGVFGSAAASTIPLTLHATVVDRRTSGSRASDEPARFGAAL